MVVELQQELRASMERVHEMHVQGCTRLMRIETALGIQLDVLGTQKHATFCAATETSNNSSTADADVSA